MKVWENSKKLWKHSPVARVSTAFLVLPNFHSCLYNSIVLRYLSTDREIYYETLRWTQLIYLRISNITSVTKNRLLNSTSYYRTKLSLLLNLSHHWHELTVNLDNFKEQSLWSTWPWTKFSNSVSNNNPLQLLHLVSADQQSELYSFSTRSPPINNRTLQLLQQDTTTSLLGHCQKSTF